MIIIVAIVISSGMFALFYEQNPKLVPQESEKFKDTYSIIEFKLPENNTSPLFPVYDKNHNVIWVGDTKVNSSRIWEFDLDSKKFTEHKFSGTNIISKIALDQAGTIWYIDPFSKLLGNYNLTSDTNELIKIPTNGTVADLVANQKNVWIIVSDLDKILRYDIQSKNFTTNSIPTAHGSPIGITIDNNGYLWIVEAVGKILRIDPSDLQMLEFSPKGNLTLKLPVAIKSDPATGDIYVAEHGEDAVFAFYTQNETFKRLPLHPDPDALPFGMTFDIHENLWVAEHTVNKIAVLDPRTGQSTEVEIPSANPLTQWLTSDSKGNVWLAEPGGSAIGVVNNTGK